MPFAHGDVSAGVQHRLGRRRPLLLPQGRRQHLQHRRAVQSGVRAGTEVAQLYLGFPASAGEPPRVLRGFERVSLAAGESRTVTIELGPRQMSCWSTSGHGPYVPSGTFRFAIGGSSRDLPLQALAEIQGFGP